MHTSRMLHACEPSYVKPDLTMICMLCRGPDHGDSLMPHYSQGTGKWTSFFVMAPINTRIVRRSHALLGQPFGALLQDFLCTSPMPL